jgi:hypothetical protein
LQWHLCANFSCVQFLRKLLILLGCK